MCAGPCVFAFDVCVTEGGEGGGGAACVSAFDVHTTEGKGRASARLCLQRTITAAVRVVAKKYPGHLAVQPDVHAQEVEERLRGNAVGPVCPLRHGEEHARPLPRALALAVLRGRGCITRDGGGEGEASVRSLRGV